MSNFLITLFFGWSGAHKFKEGSCGLGILYLLTFGLFGVGWIVDTVRAFNNMRKYTNPHIDHNDIFELYVSGPEYRKSNVESVLSPNISYSISDDDFINRFSKDERVYKYNIKTIGADLVPEPTNKFDSNAIKVMVKNVHVGYIPADMCIELKTVIEDIDKVRAVIRGGDYKFHSNGEVYECQRDFSIVLKISLNKN